jgi:predicted house-cleaning NTP pyrophosphatase (Maf/HAM1 superfamily)
VIDEAGILGKPADWEDAERMLKQLRGRTHQVYTGVAIYRVSDGKMLTELCVTDVPMRAYSDDEISAYVQTGDPWMVARMPSGIQFQRWNPCGLFCQRHGITMCRGEP